MARTIYRDNDTERRLPRWPLFGLAIVLVIALIAGYYQRTSRPSLTTPDVAAQSPSSGAGKVLGVDSVQSLTASETQALARQNYGSVAPVVTQGVTKITFHYQSADLNGSPVVVYGRAYLPEQSSGQLPVFAFAPGTTGIGDQCAASLEQVKTANWGNYDSHLATYATEGYLAVTTDYEGMRDPGRLHHYMVGPLEGRALLDSIRALRHLDLTKGRIDRAHIFVAGYSQGGHAAFWADTINATYAPDIKLKGVVGYGPVLSVEQTMNDVTRGSILDWFGPYVVASYTDYYHHDYNVAQIFVPRVANTLLSDVTSHCVDSAYSFWGHDDTKTYQPAYLAAIANGTLAHDYPQLVSDLAANATGTEATASAKLINQGHYDVVVLPGQAQAALPTMCQQSKGPVQLKIYPTATHFNTMVVSLKDTLAWMKQLRDGSTPSSSCP